MAKDKTLAALGGLKPGFTGADLVAVLNLSIVNFDTGSAAISAESRDLLTKAAPTMKQMPAGTVIEISGHTDSTGDPAANLALSQQRADAVRTTLINLGVSADALKAKGYGDTKPVASNDTVEGPLPEPPHLVRGRSVAAKCPGACRSFYRLVAPGSIARKRAIASAARRSMSLRASRWIASPAARARNDGAASPSGLGLTR